MEGFFVDVDCSKILDSNETSYKIFIDKSNMTIVYELIEWIRFMFNLEKCVFLINENSVIHEFEDIRVLEILKPLEIRPCLRSNCVHRKMEENLLNKLNTYIHWNEMRVHKLFQTRCNKIIQKVNNQQNYLDVNKKSNNFLLESHQNFFEKMDKSKNSGLDIFSNLKNCSLCFESRKGTDVKEKCVDSEDQLHLNKVDSVNENITDFEEMGNPKNFFSNNLSSLPEDSDLNSCANKKQKIQIEPKKNLKRNSRKAGVPFSLGALLSEIRQKAQTEKLNEKQETDQTEELFNSVCSVEENSEHQNEGSLKRKRKRRHKKQNFKGNFDDAPNDTSLSYYGLHVAHGKPNHIRFSDADEAIETIETETVENNCLINNVKPQNVDFIAEESGTISVMKINENKDWEPKAVQNETCEKLMDKTSEGLQSDDGGQKKEMEDPQQNLSDLESIKEKFKHPIVCMRFY